MLVMLKMLFSVCCEYIIMCLQFSWQAKGHDPAVQKYTLDLARGFSFPSLKSGGLISTVTKHMKLFDFSSLEIFPAEACSLVFAWCCICFQMTSRLFQVLLLAQGIQPSHLQFTGPHATYSFKNGLAGRQRESIHVTIDVAMLIYHVSFIVCLYFTVLGSLLGRLRSMMVGWQ